MLSTALERTLDANERELFNYSTPYIAPVVSIAGHDGVPGIVQALGRTLGDLLESTHAPREELILGLARRENGLVIAPTNKGKTTIARNLAIGLASGEGFAPLALPANPKRVAYFDFEDDPAYAKYDLGRMLQRLSWSQTELAKENLKIYCEETVNGDPLILSDPTHLLKIVESLETFRADFVIIDTISKGFSLRSENDNSEVKEVVMIPLKRLAMITNSAVLALHHVGKAKSEEGQTREAAHSGRGASTFADHSRSIYKLDADSINDTLTLSFPKLKGPKQSDVILRLDAETRWFSVIEASQIRTIRDRVFDLFGDNGAILSTANIVEALKGIVSERSVKTFLKEAVDLGDLIKSGHGRYQVPGLEIREGNESAKVQSV